MRSADPSWENQFRCAGGAAGVLVAGVLAPELGLRLGQDDRASSPKEKGIDPEDALFDLLIADRLNTGNILFIMDDKDVETALADPFVAFCTDSGAGADGRHPLRARLAPARLGLDGAHPRPLRAREEAPHASRRRSAR